MKTLAIEISTDTGSIALLEGRETVFERDWRESRDERQGFFTLLHEVAQAECLCLESVDTFVVGVGPGSFAGLRMAVSAACGLAAPGGRRVVGISSAEAVAWAVMGETDADEVVVWGDARRNELWAMRFGRGAAWPERRSGMMVGGFGVVPEEWARSKALWVTADGDRIGPRLKLICPPGVECVEKRMLPAARHLGWLGVVKREAGEATEPLLPVYVHPAVAETAGEKPIVANHEEIKRIP